MRSNRLRGCLVVAALFTGTSSASAQDTDEKTDKTADTAAPEKVADKANLTVLLGGESGLNERVMKLL